MPSWQIKKPASSQCQHLLKLSTLNCCIFPSMLPWHRNKAIFGFFSILDSLIEILKNKIAMTMKKKPTPKELTEKLISSFGICLLSNSLAVILTKWKRVKLDGFPKRFQTLYSNFLLITFTLSKECFVILLKESRGPLHLFLKWYDHGKLLAKSSNGLNCECFQVELISARTYDLYTRNLNNLLTTVEISWMGHLH